MPNKTTFSEEWLRRKDSNGVIMELWCEKTGSKFEAFCKYCRKVVRCDNRGFSQLLKHSESKLHLSQTKDIFSGTQQQLQKTVEVHGLCGPSTSVSLWSHKDSVTKAELIWSLKTAGSNYSFASSDNIGDTFRAMFPDSQIAEKFQMSKSKMSYMISEATGPYFHSILLDDVKNSLSPFTLSYDELTNKQIKKQLDINIRYWSEEANQVNVNHLATHLMGQAKAKDIGDCVMKSMNENNLMLKDLITLGSDGPYVNKAVFHAISEKKKAADLPPLLDIGTCPLHIAHNAFGKGVKEFGKEAVDLIIDLHNFFKLSPVRKEEMNNIQVDLELNEVSFLKHVETRWLTLVPAAQRVITQWSALKTYFITELPKRDKKILDNARYRRILKCLKDAPLKILSQLHFLVHASRPFERFLMMFQSEDPLIQVLYDKMCTLVKSVFSRFVKTSELKKRSVQELALLKFPCSEIEIHSSELDVGSNTRRVLTNLKPESQTVILHTMRLFYHKVAQDGLSKLPLDNPVIQNCSCLSIQNRCEPSSSKAITKLAESIPLVPPLNIDVICDEWKVLQCEDIPDEWCFTEKGKHEEKDGEFSSEEEISESEVPAKIVPRIDHYWAKIFSLQNSLGEERFPELRRLVRAVLVLPHGNSDVERGFSQTSNFLTSKRSCLSAASVSGVQTTKDGLRKCKNRCDKVPITKDFIKKGQSAYRSYLDRIEEEKRRKAERRKNRGEGKERQRKELEEKEKREKEREERSLKAKESMQLERNLGKKEEAVKEDLHNYSKMMEEANDRIKRALKNSDLKGAKVGQTMLEAAFKKVEESKSRLEEIRVEQKEVEKNKRTLLDCFSRSSRVKKLKKN